MQQTILVFAVLIGTASAYVDINGMPPSFDSNPFGIERVVQFLHRSMCAGVPGPNMTNVFASTAAPNPPQQQQNQAMINTQFSNSAPGMPAQRPQPQPNVVSSRNPGTFSNMYRGKHSRGGSVGKLNRSRSAVAKTRMSPVYPDWMLQQIAAAKNVTDQENVLIRAFSASVRNVWLGSSGSSDVQRCTDMTIAEENLMKFRFNNNLPLSEGSYPTDTPFMPPPPPPPMPEPIQMWSPGAFDNNGRGPNSGMVGVGLGNSGGMGGAASASAAWSSNMGSNSNGGPFNGPNQMQLPPNSNNGGSFRPPSSGSGAGSNGNQGQFIPPNFNPNVNPNMNSNGNGRPMPSNGPMPMPSTGRMPSPNSNQPFGK